MESWQHGKSQCDAQIKARQIAWVLFIAIFKWAELFALLTTVCVSTLVNRHARVIHLTNQLHTVKTCCAITYCEPFSMLAIRYATASGKCVSGIRSVICSLRCRIESMRRAIGLCWSTTTVDKFPLFNCLCGLFFGLQLIRAHMIVIDESRFGSILI